MAKRTYDITVGGECFRLRLTLGGQRALKERFGEEALESVLTAAVDGERMAALLTQALSWAGNSNRITDGEVFYDHLVDCGWGGQEDFGPLACEIAAHSGLISREQADKLKRSLLESVSQAFDALNIEEEAPQRPTQRP